MLYYGNKQRHNHQIKLIYHIMNRKKETQGYYFKNFFLTYHQIHFITSYKVRFHIPYKKVVTCYKRWDLDPDKKYFSQVQKRKERKGTNISIYKFHED